MVNRIVVGAHYGLTAWLAQRVSAAVMAVFAVLFLIRLVMAPPLNFETWKGLFTPGWMRFMTLLFLLSIMVHAWVGMRDIWMDYIKHTGLRLTLQVVTILWLVGCTGWAMQILWRV